MINKQLLVVTTILLALAGCKVVVVVPEGGSVTTTSEAITCAEGQTCVVDVVDIFFDETFMGTPNEGHSFAGWVKRDRGMCGGKTKPCRLFTSAFEGNAILMSFLENQEEEFYLEASFEAEVSGEAICHFTQQTPGGIFDVCQTGQDEASCGGLGGTLSQGSCLTGDPVGYCSTADGDAYYYAGSPADLELGCNFAQGTWVTL